MKHIIITSLLILSSLMVRADERLVLVQVEDQNHLYTLFENQDLTIHYYSDAFIIASLAEGKTVAQSVVLDEKAFSDTRGYFIVYCPPAQRQSYLTDVQHAGKLLYANDWTLIMKPLDETQQLHPAKNDGMVFISQRKASLPKRSIDFPVITEEDPIILNLVEKVDADNIIANIQTMQDFGTRRCNKEGSVVAQNWIKGEYESYGLDVSLHKIPDTYPWWGGGKVLSDNVIAIQYGTQYPDEYIICGGHYDSFAFSGATEPGADDNASGTAGIMEIARILSQYELQRSIIYCAFTAEECGLYGSEYYAQKCSNDGLNVLGYFNLDMIGYLKPGTPVHVSLIYPSFAAPLANYNNNITDIYFPNIPITSYPGLSGGDSDHTSFNQNGIYGIWTFEDWQYDSPHIHTSNDLSDPA